MKAKVIISLFETVKLLVSISPRNLYNSLKSIKENDLLFVLVCPESVNILAIVLGTIIGIVVIGLILLLIWRLFTTIHDRREFAKFEKETQNAKFDTVSIIFGLFQIQRAMDEWMDDMQFYVLFNSISVISE